MARRRRQALSPALVVTPESDQRGGTRRVDLSRMGRFFALVALAYFIWTFLPVEALLPAASSPWMDTFLIILLIVIVGGVVALAALVPRHDRRGKLGPYRILGMATSLAGGYLLWALYPRSGPSTSEGFMQAHEDDLAVAFFILVVAFLVLAKLFPEGHQDGPWQPTTKMQAEAVWSLKPHDLVESWARTISPGMDEVHVDVGGAYRRYLIADDGTVTLTRDGQRAPAYTRARALALAGMILFILSVLLHDRLTSGVFWLASALGSTLFVIGAALEPRPEAPAGEWAGIHSKRDDGD